MRKGLLVTLTVAATVAIGCDRPSPSPHGGRGRTTVTIGDVTWDVEISDTPELQYLGLSGRRGLADGEGKLFVYEQAGERSYCMRQMTFPLDIAFISDDLRIIRIYTMAVEPDGAGEVGYPSYGPAQYVLEVDAGSFAKFGIKVGDRVIIGQ